MRHPCGREIWQALGKVVYVAVREALHNPPHPDSKRQARRKARDLERYGARMLKEVSVTSCPPQKNDKRQDIKTIQYLIDEYLKDHDAEYDEDGDEV